MAKRALITGITGQDGSYLAELLLEKGYGVWGMVRRSSTETSERIDHLKDRITFLQADLLDQASLTKAMEEAAPDEVYNLAAQSFVPTSWAQPTLSGANSLPGYIRWDGMIGYETRSWEAQLNVYNLTDTTWYEGLYRGHAVPGTARSARLTVNFKL